MSKKAQYIHATKGPAILPQEVIKDILENRCKKGARKALAEKYGISEKRVSLLWAAYYGGATLKDYASGLKKPIPESGEQTSNITTRKVKSAIAQYSAAEPATQELERSKRANYTRKIKVSPRELNLDPQSMTDADIEIAASEISAGNNSKQMIDALVELVSSNRQLSESALQSIKLAKKSLKTKSKDIMSSSDIDTDDSQAVTRKRFETSKIPLSTEEYDLSRSGDYGDDEESYSSDLEKRKYTKCKNGNDGSCRGSVSNLSGVKARLGNCREPCDADILLKNDVRFIPRHMECDKGLRVRPSGHTRRASPVFAINREEPACNEESGDNIQDSRYEPSIHPIKHDGSKRNVQQDNSYNDIERYKKPGEGMGISRESRNRSSETIPKLPWFGTRPV